MTIKGTVLSRSISYLSDYVKDFFDNNKMFLKYFSSLSYSESIKKDAIITASLRPNKFSDANETVIFKTDDIHSPESFKYNGKKMSRDKNPNVRFRLKDNRNNIWWLADYYKKDNLLVTSRGIANYETSKYYKDVFDFLIENKYISKKESKRISREKLSFGFSFNCNYMLEGKPINLNNYLENEDYIRIKYNKKIDSSIVRSRDAKDHGVYGLRSIKGVRFNGEEFKNGNDICEFISKTMKSIPSCNLSISNGNGTGIISVASNNLIRKSSGISDLLRYFLFKPFLSLFQELNSRGYSLLSVDKEKLNISMPTVLFANKKIAKIITSIVYSLCSKHFNNEDIIISHTDDTATVKEYIDIIGLSKEEAQYMIEFKNKSSRTYRYEKNIVKCWNNNDFVLTEPSKYKLNLSVHKSDYFNSSLYGEIFDVIENANESKSHLLKSDINIIIYGLKSSRGDYVVSGFNSDECNTVSHPPVIESKINLCENDVYFGFSKYVRDEFSCVSDFRYDMLAKIDVKILEQSSTR